MVNTLKLLDFYTTIIKRYCFCIEHYVTNNLYSVACMSKGFVIFKVLILCEFKIKAESKFPIIPNGIKQSLLFTICQWNFTNNVYLNM